jgi:DNA repair protein RadC
LRVGTGGENVMRVAQRLLVKFGGLGGLARASTSELCAEKGLGEAKVAQLKAAFELGRRLLVESPDERPTITSPADAANLLLGEMGLLEQESMRVILLDTRNRVQAIQTVYQGSLNTTMVRVSELFREAVRANCAAIIVAHNHPSGDPSPSPEDVAITKDIVAAGKLLNIDVLDHLVIGRQRFVSLKERGLGFG